MSLPPEKLDYGMIDTQFGVVTQTNPDGGITITVPMPFFRRVLHSGNIVAIISHWVSGEPSPPRAVITLDSGGFMVIQPDRSAPNGAWIFACPLVDLAEIRPNRYGPGIYVRIPGKANFDLLADMNASIVKYVGEKLNDTLAGLKAMPSAGALDLGKNVS
jgi:hypothetical protein